MATQGPRKPAADKKMEGAFNRTAMSIMGVAALVLLLVALFISLSHKTPTPQTPNSNHPAVQ